MVSKRMIKFNVSLIKIIGVCGEIHRFLLSEIFIDVFTMRRQKVKRYVPIDGFTFSHSLIYYLELFGGFMDSSQSVFNDLVRS